MSTYSYDVINEYQYWQCLFNILFMQFSKNINALVINYALKKSALNMVFKREYANPKNSFAYSLILQKDKLAIRKDITECCV